MIMKQTIDDRNVWLNIHRDSARRIEPNFNFYWISDSNGRYGIRINLTTQLIQSDFSERIKGISLYINIKERVSELYIILNNNEDWEIFYALCKDLFEVSKECLNELLLISHIKTRLNRWRFFLSTDNSLTLPLQSQMGLFAELLFLKNYLLPVYPLLNSIEGWVGADLDKQDFSLDNLFIEVKSFVSSKGPIVKISSLHQLIWTIKPLYLFAVGVSRSENGISIVDLIADIKQLISDVTLTELFDDKLATYGYMDGITEAPFYKFKVDLTLSYSVNRDFPKILPGDIANQISSVTYNIDLARCSQFEVDIKTILG